MVDMAQGLERFCAETFQIVSGASLHLSFAGLSSLLNPAFRLRAINRVLRDGSIGLGRSETINFARRENYSKRGARLEFRFEID
jgi:hypothetical protein